MIPELEQMRAESALRKFCERVPPHVRAQIAYEYRFRGNAVVLYERRPDFQDPEEHSQRPFARFVFDPSSPGWALFCADRHRRWHPYKGFESVRQFERLVAEVERDPTGIFLG